MKASRKDKTKKKLVKLFSAAKQQKMVDRWKDDWVPPSERKDATP